LDAAYQTADYYLKTLAEKSGGKLMRADTISSLPDAFGKIAAELRTQYSLGYYPTNKNRNGHYRKVKVSTTRKEVAIRTRPGYLGK
jgi:Ca-activated chloride channel family protein